MLGAFAIRLAAFGVAVCRIGLLMVGLTVAVGGFVLLAVEEVGDEGGEDITGDVAADVAVEGEEGEEEAAVAEVEVVEVVEAAVETGEFGALLD